MDTPYCHIHNIDCLDFLSSIDDESVDLVVADPPYNIAFDGGRGWDKKRPEDEWVSWCVEWTRQCARILKPGRMLCVWGTFKDSNQFMKYKIAVDDDAELSSLLIPENEIVWSYNWGGRSKANFARKHEYCWCWHKAGASLKFNADDVRVARKMKTNMRTGTNFTKGTIPTCIWEKNNHTGSKEFCGWHPTTKNLDVLDRIMKAYTDKGDLIVDPFNGSGSTAISALRNGRSFEGSDLDREYIDKSMERIRDLTGINAILEKER